MTARLFPVLAMALAASVRAFSAGLAASGDETRLWQARIDAAAASGGGTVTVPAGVHPVGGLVLRSGVTLHLADGCVLSASPRLADYPPLALERTEAPGAWQAVLSAVGVTNVAVTGRGAIDGNGGTFPSYSRVGRPRGMIFYRAANVRIEDVLFRNPASWTCYLKECDGVTVRGFRTDSHANANGDGLDIDSRNVLVEKCDIDCGDDGICFKSDNPDFAVENVEVRDCVVRSTCAAIKFGTGSHGAFRNIDVHDIRIEPCRRMWMDPLRQCAYYRWTKPERFPGATGDPESINAIAIENVDGALVEGIRIRNIDVRQACVPIFIRMGARRPRLYRGVDLGIPFGRGQAMRDILIENVRALATSEVASSITGVPEFRPSGIVLRNVDIVCRGGGANAALRACRVPEAVGVSPGANMFMCSLPAYGFYLRHADDVLFDRVKVRFTGDFESRDPVVADDCRGFREVDCAYRPPSAPGERDVVSRVGYVSDTNRLASAYAHFGKIGVDLIVVAGAVGPETSDARCRELRALRDRLFPGAGRPEVVYAYDGGGLPLEKQRLLDANAPIAPRAHKGFLTIVWQTAFRSDPFLPFLMRDEFLGEKAQRILFFAPDDANRQTPCVKVFSLSRSEIAEETL